MKKFKANIAVEDIPRLPRTLTPGKLASLLGMSYWTIQRWRKNGKLKGVEIRERQWVYPREILYKFLDND